MEAELWKQIFVFHEIMVKSVQSLKIIPCNLRLI